MKRFGLLVHSRGGSYLVGGLGGKKTIQSRIEKVAKSVNMSRLEVVPVQEERKGIIVGFVAISALLLLGLYLRKKRRAKNSKTDTSTGY